MPTVITLARLVQDTDEVVRIKSKASADEKAVNSHSR